ncbi:helix-turn-helix transcriptional regulator [Aestuariivirga sp.]|uniref:helix-turn-helix transcriptional regulator n=1 Tax=Aestuariivirga sp. TaxID=2650926 RepID=UPI0035AF2975
MRRADRLFEIVQLLRGGRLRTSGDLARRLEVSTRTVWRDIADLQAQGVPIEGERGVGYLLQEGHFLPPLALTHDEMEALLWGTQLVESFADEGLANAARELRVKVASVSPEERRRVTAAMSSFPSRDARVAQTFLGTIRSATGKRRKLEISYRDAAGRETHRVVRPLGLEFWGQVWTLTCWCESRSDFRVFRCDRLLACRMLPDGFRDERGKRFADFLARLQKDQAHE